MQSTTSTKQSDAVNSASSPLSNSSSSSGASVPALSVSEQTQSGIGFAAMEDSGAYNRKVIYKANLTMEVKDYTEVQSKVRNAVIMANGYILQFTDSNTSSEVGGTYTIKVPSNGFMSFIQTLEQWNPISMERSINGQDVTDQFVDLQSRLDAKETEDARLKEFMQNATNANDLISYSNKLSEVETQIDQLKGQIRYLQNNVTYSTIQLRVYQKWAPLLKEGGLNPGQPLMLKAGESMKLGFQRLGRFFSGLIVFLAGALPVFFVLVLLGAALFIPFWYFRRKRVRKDGAD